MLNQPEEFDFSKLFTPQIQSGITLGPVEILFTMIDDESIEKERAKLG